MYAIKYLIYCCIQLKTTPEAILEISCPQENTFQFLKLIPKLEPDKVYEDAIGRFPEVIRKLVELQGFAAAELTGRLFELQNLTGVQEVINKIPNILEKSSHTLRIEGIPGIIELKELWEFGISLKWVCFGWGEPEKTLPQAPHVMSNDIKFNHLLNTALDKQGLSNFERTWWLGPTLQIGAIHMAIIRLLGSLPKIVVFPPKPKVDRLVNRVKNIIKNFDIPDDFDPSAAKVVERLKSRTQFVSYLFMANPGMVQRWASKQEPRVALYRYSLLVERIFEMYGVAKGLEFWLKSLEQVAVFYGFKNLSEVLEARGWTTSKMKAYFKAKDVLKEEQKEVKKTLGNLLELELNSDSGNSRTE